MEVYYQTSGRRNWSNLLEARIRLKEKEKERGRRERRSGERERGEKERERERERGGEDKHVIRRLLIVPVPLLV